VTHVASTEPSTLTTGARDYTGLTEGRQERSGAGAIMRPQVAPRRPWLRASGVDLTFATLLATDAQCGCQIQNSTRSLYLPVVLRFQHSQKCLPGWDANVGIGPLVNPRRGMARF
jgi:hypothetical protein